MRIHKNIPKRILSMCLVFAIGISMGVLSDHFVSENSRFQTFTEKLFRSEVCNNTLTLHYTLAHPEKKGIRKPEATLGTALSDPAKTTSLCQEYEKELKSFAYSRLSEENRLTCDMLLLYFHTRASLEKTAPWMSRWDQAWVCRHNFPFFWRNILSGQKTISLII